MNKKRSNKPLIEEYTELTKNSLVKVQFSCGGNSTSIEERDDIPIVSESSTPENALRYCPAREEDVEAILSLLKTNNLPVNDLAEGQRIFLIALSDEETVGCIAVEPYGNAGLVRSLAVNKAFRGKGIGMQLLTEAEKWSIDNGLTDLYLLTTNASAFFQKMSWVKTNKETVPERITSSSEFCSTCPSIAICMSKSIN